MRLQKRMNSEADDKRQASRHVKLETSVMTGPAPLSADSWMMRCGF